MLNYFQSIDLTKYSFPNENKPKTDYTYARTYTDYLKKPYSILEENQVEMPNLCRRSLKSPNKSPYSDLISLRNEEENITDSTAASTNPNIQTYDESMALLNFNIKRQKENKLFRNLVNDLEEESPFSQINLQYRTFTKNSAIITSNMNNLTSQSQHESKINASTMTVDYDSPNVCLVNAFKKKMNCSCRFYFSFTFCIFLLPLLLYGVNYFDYSSNYCSDIYEKTLKYQPAYMVNQNDKNNNRSKELNESLKSLTEKYIADLLSINLNNNKSNVHLIKKELDQKFNYTYTFISNRLSDQLLDKEMPKMSHEREIKQIKSFLSDMEKKYSYILKQLEDHQNKMIEQQKYFNLLNADKTGMTDFASELIGGSILFTRFTETYEGKKRWLAFFNIPIIPTYVSPRVVIQVLFFYNSLVKQR
jgi:hypothetical protein